jgi:ectoine hydroxylase-related dioxygenase (phytanoyl-CoA dioxygenase family)
VLDPELIEAFRTDGAVCVREVLDPDALALAVDAIEAVLAEPSPLAILASGPSDPGRFVEDFCNHERVPALGRLARHPSLAELAGALTGSGTVRLHHDHVLVKEPGTRQRTPWHQDQPYYNLDGRQTVSFWIPVDPVPAGASLELVAGTHRGPWLLPRTFLDGEARWFPEGTLAELPDIDADRSAHRILSWALEPGDLVAFHMLTVHGAPGFAGPGRRRVVSLRYIGDDVTHAPRPWRTSPPFPGLEDELDPGDAFDHPRFPVVWPLSRPDA